MQEELDVLQKQIEAGEPVDFQSLPAKLGFVLMRVVIHGNSIGSFKETKEHRALTDEEAAAIAKAGSLGTLDWAPKMAEGKCKDVFEGLDREVAEAFNRIRKLGSLISTRFRERTSPFGGGADGEHYRLVPVESIPDIKSELGAINVERNKCRDLCVEHFARMVGLAKDNLRGRLTTEAKRSKIEDVESHVDSCMATIESKMIPPAERFRSSIDITFKERNFAMPAYLMNDAQAQQSYKAEWDATLKASHTDAREGVIAMCDALLANKTVQTDSVKKAKRVVADFYARQAFVQCAVMAQAVDKFRDYLVQRGLYPELEKSEDGTPAYPSEKKADDALTLKVSVLRKKYIGPFRAEVMALKHSLEAEAVLSGTANPFKAKGRLVV